MIAEGLDGNVLHHESPRYLCVLQVNEEKDGWNMVVTDKFQKHVAIYNFPEGNC